ncbi:MAG: hypothetical protein ACD_29C00011G0001 [uncultured bacterium]|nr:MAG: hypothetical protein ACD_29C00011G0001 [uncultured bacterium]
MSTTTTLTPNFANAMNQLDKKSLALDVLTQHKTITDIAAHNNVSRKFIYTQKINYCRQSMWRFAITI